MKGDVSAAVRPDSDDFVRAGEAFIQWIVGGGAGYEDARSHAVFPNYVVPSVVIAAIYMNFSQPIVTVVSLNCILFSLVVTLVYRFWTVNYESRATGMSKRGVLAGMAGGMYILFGLPDPFLLSYTVLSDVMFLLWVTLFVLSASHWILGAGRAGSVIALIVAVVAPFFRPTGILLPVLLVYVFIVKRLIESGIGMRTVVAASVGLPVAATFVLIPWMVSAQIGGQEWVENIVPDTFQRFFRMAANYFEMGIVVSNRPDTYVDAPTRYMDVVEMIVYRLWYFWVPLRFGESPYSVAHNAMNLVYIGVAWPLAVVGIGKLVEMGRRHQIVALFLIVVAMGYAFLHSVTLLSFGWRYQLPGMVPLWVLAGVGLYAALGHAHESLSGQVSGEFHRAPGIARGARKGTESIPQ